VYVLYVCVYPCMHEFMCMSVYKHMHMGAVGKQTIRTTAL